MILAIRAFKGKVVSCEIIYQRFHYAHLFSVSAWLSKLFCLLNSSRRVWLILFSSGVGRASEIGPVIPYCFAAGAAMMVCERTETIGDELDRLVAFAFVRNWVDASGSFGAKDD